MTDLLEQLRRLAATDPRAARELFVALLDDGSAELEPLLRVLAAPGEGRLRQLVANAVRTRRDKVKVAGHLLAWLEHETDEFARAAIAAAVKDVPNDRYREVPGTQALPDLVDTYRYVAERLCHRVRNALPGAASAMRQVDAVAQATPEPLRGELLTAIERLKDSLRGVSRVVEFETDDAYFEWRSVPICAWLASAAKNYVTKAELLSVAVTGPAHREQLRIRANDYLLETVFWNLFKNARQASAGPCVVTVDVELRAGRVVLTVTDNGPGFPETLVGVAFQERFSTHGGGRGRGLLEVDDAVRRLSGSVSLSRNPRGTSMVTISFPLEKT